jgi:hypothetical protein
MGSVTLTDITGISASWFAFGFTFIALAAFWITTGIEKRVRKNYTEYQF